MTTTTKQNTRGPIDNAKSRNSFVVSKAGAMQESSEAAAEMLIKVTGYLCKPLEGTPGESICFTCEWDRKGYRMAYRVVSTAYDSPSAHIVVDWIEPDEAFDEDLTEAVPAITFDTCKEYEAQCERCTEDGIRKAAGMVWESIKADMERYWKTEDEICSKGGLNIATTKAMNVKLEAYEAAMNAMGYELHVIVDGLDPAKRIFEVSCAFGTVRSYAKASWIA